MILVIDNYDSFTYNLVHYLDELGATTKVVRNDALYVRAALALRPDAVLLSPGPRTPTQAGICLDLIREAADDLPILGVCLGHQAVGQALGADIVPAISLMHGKVSLIHHTGTGIFEGLTNPFSATRYHSLAVARAGLPAELRVTAWTDDGEIMGLSHRDRPVHGVQFHPEIDRDGRGSPIAGELPGPGRRQAPRPCMSETGTPRQFRELLARLADGATLGEEDADTFFTACLRGEPTPAQIAAAVTAMRLRGETLGEIIACARALRRAAVTLEHPYDVIDVCGTGGDGAQTLNVSTAVALVAAAGGLKVAKHGTRAVSSRSGSSDVLEALGVKVVATREVELRCLEAAGICFLFAPAHHAAMRHVMPIRQELGFRTIFNLLGPLSNPAGARRQLVGVFDSRWVEPLARALGALGAQRAWVAHGEGMDEITTTGPTQIAEWREGGVRLFTVTPEAVGLERAARTDLTGGDPATNAAAIRSLLAGAAGAYRDIVLLNAAAAFLVAEKVETLREGVALAAEAIDSGAAARTLETLVALTST